MALAAWAAAGAQPAVAQSSAGLPPPVRAYQQELNGVCEALGGRGSFGDDFIKRADFDADGLEDYLLDTASVSCPPASASAGTCGSAGCSVAIFLSSQDYREVWSSNLQDFRVVQGAPAARLSVSAHGSACGQIGAEVCEAVLEWDGVTFSPALSPSAADASTGATEMSAAPDWTAGMDGARIVTARTAQGPSPLNEIAVSCHDGRPMLAIRPTGRLGASVALEIGADGRTARMPLTLDARTGVYFALPASPPALMLLAGGASEADVSLNGRAIGAIPLMGAPTALAEALSPCWRGQDLSAGAARQEVARMPPPAPGAIDAELSFPPIPEGFYAVNVTCAAAAGNTDWMNYMYLTRHVRREWDGDTPLAGADDLGGGRWALRRYHGGSVMEILLTGPASFQETFTLDDGWGGSEETTIRFVHCPAESVPAEVRRDWTGPVDYEPYRGNG
ncbi:MULTISPECIES: hypothetical protein [Brevundimonas]|uniref:hypothetical protein n=1 Tax=Brevundimonas TaxID=41275 RepID=UPI00196AF93E|nr:hypothetical protein [Brevundimonas lutea]